MFRQMFNPQVQSIGRRLDQIKLHPFRKKIIQVHDTGHERRSYVHKYVKLNLRAKPKSSTERAHSS